MIVGIDPGKSGGIAAVGDNGKFIDGIRMPIIKHGKRDVVDTRKLTDWVGEISDGYVDTIVIEQVNAMPGQGVTSMFNFGRHTGAVEGWALEFGKPVQWVTPRKWKAYYNLSKDKRASLDRAVLEFGWDKRWDVLANDGIAEAALLALYQHRSST